jgi:hypothetical protein
MAKRYARSKSPPTSRQLDAKATKIVNEIVDVWKRGGPDYVVELNNGDISLGDLFDHKIEPAVRRRVYEQLLLEEQSRG